MSYARDQSNYLPEGRCRKFWSDWPGLYQSLLSDDRIWDVRDVLSASVSAFGVKQTWTKFCNTYSPHVAISAFLKDWNLDEYDLSSYLATLDILVIFAQYLISQLRPGVDDNTVTNADICLQYARRFASCIKDNDLKNIKCRPYLRWILAEKELARKTIAYTSDTPSNEINLNNFPGLTVWINALPIYIPMKSENPGWRAFALVGQEKSDELLNTALKVAQNLSDYRTEVMCLRELICRTQDPKELFGRLEHVQKNLQGDMVGYMQTCLSKYLLATNEVARQALVGELEEFDAPQPISYDMRDPLVGWCKQMVQVALYRSLGDSLTKAKMLKSLELTQDLVKDIPSDIRHRISKLNFYGTLDRRYRRGPRVRDWATNDQDEYEYELERTKLDREKSDKLRILKEEMERRKKEEELKKRESEIARAAVEKYIADKAKEKEILQKRDLEYRFRARADLIRAGMSQEQVNAVFGNTNASGSHHTEILSKDGPSVLALSKGGDKTSSVSSHFYMF
jgi:hypothetical protein